MSEISPSQLKSQVEIFLPEYNRLHGTSFTWQDPGSYAAQNSDRAYVDAIVFSQEQELLIQHKRVIWDIQHDVIRAGYVSKLVTDLIAEMQRAGLNEYFLMLNFDAALIPSKLEEKRDFTFWMTELVRAKGSRFFDENPVFSFEKDDEEFLKHLRPLVSYIHIFPREGYEKPVVGYGWSKPEIRGLPYYGDRVVSEVQKRAASYEGMVLLVEAATYVEDHDMGIISEAFKDWNHDGEIWLVEDFPERKRATKLYGKVANK